MSYYTWKKTVIYLVIGIIIGYFGRSLLGDSFNNGWRAARERIDGEDYNTIVDEQNQTQYEFIGIIKAIDGKKITAMDIASSILTERDLAERTVKVNKNTIITLQKTIQRDYWYKLVDADLAQQSIDLQTELDSGDLDREARNEKQATLDVIVVELEEKHQQAIDNIRNQMSQIKDNESELTILKNKLQELTSHYVNETINVEQLAVGDIIRAISDDDIREEQNFSAKKIIVER